MTAEFGFQRQRAGGKGVPGRDDGVKPLPDPGAAAETRTEPAHHPPFPPPSLGHLAWFFAHRRSVHQYVT